MREADEGKLMRDGRNKPCFLRVDLVLLALAVTGCTEGTAVVVLVQQIPAEARALEALAAQGSVMALERPTLDLGGGGRSEYSFSFHVPKTGTRRLLVAVVARDARGCLIAQGQMEKPLSELGQQQFPLMLSPMGGDLSCDGAVPQILFYDPKTGSDPGLGKNKEPAQIGLAGWGFRPDSAVMFGGVASPVVQWLSPLVIQAQVPVGPARGGPVDLTVTNTDGTQAVVKDGFLYLANWPASLRMYGARVKILPEIAAVVDLNGDGLPDVVGGSEGGVSVALNQGGGAFPGQEAFYGQGGGVGALSVGDFNGDSRPDLAFTPYLQGGAMTRGILLSFNQGGGRFAGVPLAEATDAIVEHIGVADLNGDGRSDLALADGQNIRVLLNQGDAVFSRAPDVPARTDGASILSVADLDGDRAPDLILSSTVGGVTRLFFNRGAGAFTAGQIIPQSDLFSVEWNNDGHLDLIKLPPQGPLHPVVYLNQGGGSFAIVAEAFPSDVFRYCPLAEDIDGDGHADLIGQTTGDDRLYLLLHEAPDRFARYLLPFAACPLIADLDRDGKKDLVYGVAAGGGITVLLQEGGK